MDEDVDFDGVDLMDADLSGAVAGVPRRSSVSLSILLSRDSVECADVSDGPPEFSGTRLNALRGRSIESTGSESLIFDRSTGGGGAVLFSLEAVEIAVAVAEAVAEEGRV